MTDVGATWVAFEAEIAQVYGTEKSVYRTARRLGVGEGMVKGALRRQGVRLPDCRAGRPALVPAETQARMVELFAGGMSKYRIAKETGWTEGAVKRAIERAGAI